MKYDIILWDIDDTLLDFLAAEANAIRACFKKFNLGECDDAMLSYYSALNTEYWKKLERGEMTKAQILVERFEKFFEHYGLDAHVASDFNAEYQVRLGDTIVFFPNALETITELKGKVKQYIVTNGTAIAQTRKIRNSGIGEIVDGVFISERMGYEKPSREYFDEVFAKIAADNFEACFVTTDDKGIPCVNRERVIIIGDSLTSDITGGNNAGIDTCWFNKRCKENTTDLRIDYEIKDLREVMGIL